MRLSSTKWIAGAIACLLLGSASRAQVSEGDFTYAIELNGVVCGYTDVHVSTAGPAERPYTLVEQKTFVMLSALGSRFNTNVDLLCHVDPDTGDMRLLRTHIRQAEVDVQAEIRIADGVAYCTSSLLDEEVRVPLSADVLVGNPLYSLHLLREARSGELVKKTRKSFDSREFEVQDVTFDLVGRETLELDGKVHEALLVDVLNHGTGQKARIWIDTTNGLTLKSTDPRGQTAYLAGPSIKKRIELVNMDETITSRTNVSIPDVHSIAFMKVKAVLEPTGQWITPADLNVPGQRFTGTVTENLIEGVFEIEHPRYDGAGAPPYPPPAVTDEVLTEYVEPGPFVESEDPVLVAKAEELAAGSSSSWEAACRLSQWVADNITYEIPGGGTARKTYELRAGECGSHSILLATFCRALDIPARVVWGCMYTPNFGGSFGQHAWTEIHMGEAGWIPVDATASEAGFVDSGHIRLGEHQSLSIALNAKSMEVLDHRLRQVEADSGSVAKYEPFVGQYDPPGGGEPFEVLVAQGRLAIDIPDKMVLIFEEPDEAGRWYCTLSRNLFCTFEWSGDDVAAFRLHELVRMRRLGDPEVVPEGVPESMQGYLAEYRFPGVPDPFTVIYDEGQLAVHDPIEDRVVHLEPAEEDGRWIDEFDKNMVSFDVDEDGRVRAMLLEAINTFVRR